MHPPDRDQAAKSQREVHIVPLLVSLLSASVFSFPSSDTHHDLLEERGFLASLYFEIALVPLWFASAFFTVVPLLLVVLSLIWRRLRRSNGEVPQANRVVADGDEV